MTENPENFNELWLNRLRAALSPDDWKRQDVGRNEEVEGIASLRNLAVGACEQISAAYWEWPDNGVSVSTDWLDSTKIGVSNLVVTNHTYDTDDGEEVFEEGQICLSQIVSLAFYHFIIHARTSGRRTADLSLLSARSLETFDRIQGIIRDAGYSIVAYNHPLLGTSMTEYPPLAWSSSPPLYSEIAFWDARHDYPPFDDDF